MRWIQSVVLSIFAAELIVQASDAAEPKVYEVAKRPDSEVKIDGLLDEPDWGIVSWLNDFGFPWAAGEAPATKFAAFTNVQQFCFAFRVVDRDIVIVNDNPNSELRVADGDRVELFFARDAELTRYYCLEMAPSGKVLDYEAAHYRRFDEEWDWPRLEVAATRQSDGYIVEGAILLETFRQLGLPDMTQDSTLLAGIFRGEFTHVKNSRLRKDWISWVRPVSKKPDFHVPGVFGVLRQRAN